MIYFSSKEIKPAQFDSEQYEALEQFKNSLKGRSLFAEFESSSDFASKLGRQLALKVNDKYPNGKPKDQGFSGAFKGAPQPGMGMKMMMLWKEAVRDPQGIISVTKELSGLSIRTSKRTFFDRGNARDQALWIGAISDLLGHGFIEDKNGRNEVFQLTHRGYIEGEALQDQPFL